jgi:uncharacterized protein (TIGR03083 family)
VDWERLGPALDVRPLFAPEREQLLQLLRQLPPAAWSRPTICPGWDVHDVVSHLVHDYVRRLSGTRDGHIAAWVVAGEELAQSLDRVNQEFVLVARTFSSRLLTDLIAHLGPQLDELWIGLQMNSLGGAVSWVAPHVEAPVWLDVAREYTEFWVHQQQIRDAVGRPGARQPELLVAVVDAFVRSLPRALAGTAAPSGTAVTMNVEITEDVSTAWTATKDGQGWRLDRRANQSADAHIHLTADTLWRLATRGLGPSDAWGRIDIDGDSALAASALQLVSIVR